MKLTTTGLDRFVEAQDAVYHTVCEELRAGRKQSHWMWFVFPQIAGLGHSPVARHFALASEDEARAYWLRPLLRGRLLECSALVLGHHDKTTPRTHAGRPMAGTLERKLRIRNPFRNP